MWFMGSGSARLGPRGIPAGDPEAIPCDGRWTIRTFVPPGHGSWVLVPRSAGDRLDTWKRPGRGRFVQNVRPRSPATTSRSCPPMRTIRLLVAGLTILAVAACATTTPGWTYAARVAIGRAIGRCERIGGGTVGSATASASAARARPWHPAPRRRPAHRARPDRRRRRRGGREHRLHADRAQRRRERGLPDPVRQQRRRDPAQRRDQGCRPARRSSRATSSRASRSRPYDVPALAAGTYQFVCSVHPNMVGTLTRRSDRLAPHDAAANSSATRTPMRGRRPRVRHVEAGEATLVVLDRTVVLPGRRRPAVRPRRARCAPPTGGRGRSAGRARPTARSSTSSSRTAATRRRSATRSRSTSTGRAASP